MMKILRISISIMSKRRKRVSPKISNSKAARGLSIDHLGCPLVIL